MRSNNYFLLSDYCISAIEANCEYLNSDQIYNFQYGLTSQTYCKQGISMNLVHFGNPKMYKRSKGQMCSTPANYEGPYLYPIRQKGHKPPLKLNSAMSTRACEQILDSSVLVIVLLFNTYVV